MMRWHAVHTRRQHRATHAALRAALVAALQCVFCGCATGRFALVVNGRTLINVCKGERKREISFQLGAANQLQQKSERMRQNHTSFPSLAMLLPWSEHVCACLHMHTFARSGVAVSGSSSLLYFAYHHLAQISFV